jgi:hypothetical protein
MHREPARKEQKYLTDWGAAYLSNSSLREPTAPEKKTPYPAILK